MITDDCVVVIAHTFARWIWLGIARRVSVERRSRFSRSLTTPDISVSLELSQPITTCICVDQTIPMMGGANSSVLAISCPDNMISHMTYNKYDLWVSAIIDIQSAVYWTSAIAEHANMDTIITANINDKPSQFSVIMSDHVSSIRKSSTVSSARW